MGLHQGWKFYGPQCLSSGADTIGQRQGILFFNWAVSRALEDSVETTGAKDSVGVSVESLPQHSTN